MNSPSPSPQVRTQPSARIAALTCLTLTLLFVTLSQLATSTKSPTYDEPLHAASAYVHLRYGDLTPDVDNPPLFKYFAALPTLLSPPADALTTTPDFRAIPADNIRAWHWANRLLYHTPGTDAGRLIARSRAMMLLPAAALVAVTALFAGRAAGPVAAVVSCFLVALDPNLLAHASLVKNDIPLTLLVTAIVYLLWRSHDALTLPRAAALALLCASAVTTKFNGPITGPMIAAALVTRALLPQPWTVAGRTLATRPRRLLAALVASAATAAFVYAFVWAAYGFRFSPTPDPSVHFDRRPVIAGIAINETRARVGHVDVTTDELAQWQPGPAVRAATFALDHHLLPESFGQGFLVTYMTTRNRPYFFLGHVGTGGNWLYFPLTFLSKTPLATLAAFFLLPLSLLPSLSPQSSVLSTSPSPNPQSPVRNPQRLWLSICLCLPILFYGLPALAANLNIGLRHIFPIYPPLFIAAGVAAARLFSNKPRATRNALLALAALLSIETASAFPNYIPFFNYAAGGPRGGFNIATDSNLDWGQDLPALAAWQRAHPDKPLYLAYFGTADPAYYGIRYHNLPGGYAFGPPPDPTPPEHGVLAISASLLHGGGFSVFAPDNQTPRAPTEVLNGSIYLFDLDAPPPH